MTLHPAEDILALVVGMLVTLVGQWLAGLFKRERRP